MCLSWHFIKSDILRIDVIVADIADEVDRLTVLAVDIEEYIPLCIPAFPECGV